MRVLITGGAGFIGSHVVDAFQANGDEVFVVDDLSHGDAGRLPPGTALFVESLLNASQLNDLVMKVNPGLICHLAAQVDVRVSVSAPSHDASVNVVGTVNLLEAARRAGARIIFSSTGGAIYGTDAPIPSAETVQPAPGSPYGVAKFCAEQYVALFNRLHGTRHAILRFANVYGPRQGASGEAGVVSIFCVNSIQGRPITIYGDGNQTRDYVYVSDVARAFLATADYGEAGLWNIGTGAEVTVLELANLVSGLSGGHSQLVFAPARAGELLRSAVSARQAERDLGWEPRTALTDGVREVLRWFAAEVRD